MIDVQFSLMMINYQSMISYDQIWWLIMINDRWIMINEYGLMMINDQCSLYNDWKLIINDS